MGAGEAALGDALAEGVTLQIARQGHNGLGGSAGQQIEHGKLGRVEFVETVHGQQAQFGAESRALFQGKC